MTMSIHHIFGNILINYDIEYGV